MEHVFIWGIRLSAPSCWHGTYGTRKTLSLTFLLMLVQLGCKIGILEYVATYAKACSLPPPREPFIWSWTCKTAASGAEKASCVLRRAPAVSFRSGSGEFSLLSYRYVWPGVSALSLTHFWFYSFMLPETAGGNCSFRYEMMFKKIGEVNTAPLLTCRLDPVPSAGASCIWTFAHFEGNRKAGVRVPDGPQRQWDWDLAHIATVRNSGGEACGWRCPGDSRALPPPQGHGQAAARWHICCQFWVPLFGPMLGATYFFWVWCSVQGS